MDFNPIRPEELLALSEYDRVRDERRASVIRLRGLLRVEIGPWVSVLFENRETVLYQIQEMLRIERITDPIAVRHEIETYEELRPGPGELSGTLFIEIANEEERHGALPALFELEKKVRLRIGVGSVRGVDKCPIDPAIARPQAACVYYLRFSLLEASWRALREGSEAWLEIDHPRYAHAARLTTALVAELAKSAP